VEAIVKKREKGVLRNKKRLGPFPMDRIRRVEKPTTIITDAVQRIDLRNIAYGLAARGEYGPVVQQSVQRILPEKYPLSAAQKDVIDHISLIKPNLTAAEIAPIPRPTGADLPYQSRGILFEG
jgi:epoxyqueuosine reductase